MLIEIPDEYINPLQRDSINKLLGFAKNMSFANIYVRIDGRDEHLEADYLNHAREVTNKRPVSTGDTNDA